MELLKYANLALRFLLELAALAALGYWGWQTGTTTLARILLAAGAPVLMAVLWGAFVAPRARFVVPWRVKMGLSILILGLAAAALRAAGQPTLALIFAGLIVLNHALMVLWNQRQYPVESRRV